MFESTLETRVRDVSFQWHITVHALDISNINNFSTNIRRSYSSDDLSKIVVQLDYNFYYSKG